MVYINIIMVMYMKEIIKKDFMMEKENINMPKGMYMRVNTKKI